MSLNLSDLTKRLFRRFTKKAAPARGVNRFRPMLERCEGRDVPSVPEVSFYPSGSSEVTEGGTLGNQYLYRSGDTSAALTVNLSYSGTATRGADYTAPLTATFQAGYDTSDEITLATVDDLLVEGDETSVLTVEPGTGYTVSPYSASGTQTIHDNDQYVSVAKIADATEGGTGTFRFTRTGYISASLTVPYSVNGTATLGTDFAALSGSVTFDPYSDTVDVSVVALADNVVESSETVVATLMSGTGYSIGGLGTDTLTITDDPPVIAVTAGDTFEGSATGGFTFTRRGGNFASSLTATYSLSGTATSVTDFTAITGAGSVTFAAGVDRVEVFVEALGDNTADDGETVIATLTGAGTGYTIDTAAAAATVTIADQPLTISVIRLADGEEGVIAAFDSRLRVAYEVSTR